jgi:hypothetical protein
MRIEKLTWRGRLLYVLVALATAFMVSITAVDTASAKKKRDYAGPPGPQGPQGLQGLTDATGLP